VTNERPSLRRVADGVDVVRLTSASGLTVNAYRWVVRDTVILVDAGFPTTHANFRAAFLGGEELAPQAIFYTHSHEDHMGGGAALGPELGCPAYVRRGTTPAFGNFYDYYDRPEHWDAWYATVLPKGPAHDEVQRLRRLSRATVPVRAGGTGVIHAPHPVDIGDVVRCGDVALTCLDAAGHDQWHVAWYDEERRWLFTGDVLLGVPTPVMSALGDSMRAYRTTLRRWQAGPEVALFLPGHGRPSTDFGGAVARSLGFLEFGYVMMVAAFDAARDVIDPAAFAARVGDGDRRRMFLSLTNLISQLEELASLGLVRLRADRCWERLRALPSFDTLDACYGQGPWAKPTG